MSPPTAPTTVATIVDDTEVIVPPDSLTAEMVGHWTYLVLEGAAFLMQGMHPVIGEVVEKYSAAYTDPGGRAIRSVDSVLRWTYGGLEAVKEGDRVRSMHEPLTMRSAETGKQISALNPQAYQWVIATAYITTIKAGPLLIGREFTRAERAELLRDNRRLARLLHVPMKGYPASDSEFDVYFDQMIAEVLVATPRTLESIEIMRTGEIEVPKKIPPFARGLYRAAAKPGLSFTYLSIAGLLDPRLRTMIGIEWTAAEQRRLERIYAIIRSAYRVLPERLTYFPLAYHARKHHRCIEKMRKREEKSWAYRVRPKQPLHH
ncbi:oxygenase MpaB family protein [Gordonia sp. CPCC 205333]|uniref:oxygenase MpaB family protein n=1 Tax=Gordonia sp. CPCC 205333 TaxID=3140790 RepID=UPI003AF3B91A